MPMERVKWIDHKGKAVIFTDMSGLKTSEEQIAVLRRAQELICAQPHGSVLSLIDYTGIHYNVPGVQAQKEFSAAVGPHMKGSAVVGVTGMLQVVYRSVIKLTKRKIVTFDTREAALDWLATQ
jgi:hypothetical protein